MFDPGVPHPRRHVSTHLYVNCALTTAEFVITACGTYFVIKVWELYFIIAQTLTRPTIVISIREINLKLCFARDDLEKDLENGNLIYLEN